MKRAVLARHRWTIDDFASVRSGSIPGLDDPCGRFLTFRDLIKCGETQAESGLANLPKAQCNNNLNRLPQLSPLTPTPLPAGARGSRASCSRTLPKRFESWNALYELAEQVLDPVMDW